MPENDLKNMVLNTAAEPSPASVEFEVGGCQDAVTVQAGEVLLQSLGRIVQVDAVIKNLCPGKRAAAAVLLTEVDAQGTEHPRGVKTLLIPAQTGDVCQDVELKCITFVVPEAVDTAGTPHSICEARSFRARVMANYLDTDYTPCTAEAAVL